MPKQDNSKRDLNNAFARYTGVALKVAVIIILFSLGGKYLDNRLELTQPWFTLVGSLLGVGIGIYSLIKDLSE